MSMFHELMMRKKEEIMYATIKGTLTENNGVFSGFSTSNYLEVQGLYDFSKPFEIKTKIKIGSTPSASSFITVKNSNVGSMIVMVGNGWNIGFYITDSSGNSIVNGGYTPNNILSSNTDCFVKVVFTGTEYACYISTDDTTYTKYSIVTSSRTIGNSCNIKLGANPPNQSFAVGTIDLNQTNIKLGSTKYKLQAVVGYKIVGSPTIVDGVVSGFSASDYLQLPTIPSTIYEKIQLHTKIRTDNSVSGCCLFTVSTAYYQGIYISTSTKQIGGYVQFGAGKNLRSNIIAEANTDYIIDFIIDITNKKLTLTVNGNTVEAENITTSTLRSITYLLGNGYDGAFNGSMFLSETSLKVNNKLWFNGQQA